MALSTDEDDLYESCLSPSTFFSSLDDDDDDYTGADDGAMREMYFEPLRLSANDENKSQCRTAVADPVGLQRCSSLQNSQRENVMCTFTDISRSPREQSGKDGVNKPNVNRSDCFLADLTNGLLSETLSSVHMSSDGSVGESWLSSDLTSVTSLSDSDFSCSVHSIRIERKLIDDGNDSKCGPLVETTLIPTSLDVDATPSCQHGNLECSYLSDDRTFLHDWKSGSEMNNDVEVTVPASVKAMSSAELRSQLAEFGVIPGPITDSTRRLHELRLSKLLAGHNQQKLTAGNGHNTG